MSLVQIRSSPAAGCAEGASSRPLVDRRARQVRYLRVSLTDRCNYRCTYCMPDRPLRYGARADVLGLEEVERLVAAFARWGVRRVRLTGGEPTLRRNLPWLVQRLAEIPTDDGGRLKVVLTTNGHTLAAHAASLYDAGLSSLTVSLDSLRPDRFAAITRRGALASVIEGIEAACAAGFSARPGGLKLNTVALAGWNEDELGEIATWALKRDIVPRFIELMPMSGGELYAPGELLPAAEIRRIVAAELGAELVPDAGADVRGSGPASYVRVQSGPFAGRFIGTIGAMTENFCEGCNRLRISATGQLHACLARDETGDLRAALRSHDPSAVEAIVRAALGTKRDGHGFNLDGTGGPAKAMISIGG